MAAKVLTGLIISLSAVNAIVAAEQSHAPQAWPTVRIWPEAVVPSARVRLADLASVKGFDQVDGQRVLQIQVCAAPEPGASRSIRVAQIRNALVRARVNLAAVCLVGAAECRIYRPQMPDPVRPSHAPGKDSPGEPQKVTRSLAEAVRQFFSKRLAHLGGRVEVTFSKVSRSVLQLTGENMTFKVHPRGKALLGLVAINVDVLEAGYVVKTVPILAEAAVFQRVLIARRAINRSAVIGSDDVTLAERCFGRSDRLGLTDAAAVVGQQARRYIPRGDMIHAKDMKPRPLVRRGDYVTVWLRRAGFVIKSPAKALQDGTYGQQIEVRSEPGGEVYPAVVTGSKVVEATQCMTNALSKAH